MDAFDGLLRETMLAIATICLPVLGLAAAAGLCVAIVQAATQVQEQTLSLVPKLLSVGLALVVFGSAGMQLLARLFGDAIRAIPGLTGA
jgi:flagellar biosynthetic protein FliQ